MDPGTDLGRMTATGTDVVIIGGGIVGASAAAFLAEAGATVTLVERDARRPGHRGRTPASSSTRSTWFSRRSTARRSACTAS